MLEVQTTLRLPYWRGHLQIFRSIVPADGSFNPSQPDVRHVSEEVALEVDPQPQLI